MSKKRSSNHLMFQRSQILKWVSRWWVHATVYSVPFTILSILTLPSFFGILPRDKPSESWNQKALCFLTWCHHSLVGFYFNNSYSDYQVLRVHSFEDTNKEVCLGDSLAKTCAVRVQKYSLREGLWREIKHCDNQCVSVNGCLFWTENSVTVRETLYWVAMEVSEKVSNEMIISVNACNYALSRIGLPPLVAGDAEVHKKLAVIICLEMKNVAQCLDLWVFYDKYEGVECWCKMHTIGMLPKLERPVGILKDEILVSTDKVIRSASGTIPFLPEDDIGAEFSYSVFNYVENFLFDGNVVVEEDDSLENDGLSLLNLFISNIDKLSIEDCGCYGMLKN